MTIIPQESDGLRLLDYLKIDRAYVVGSKSYTSFRWIASVTAETRLSTPSLPRTLLMWYFTV